jgi:hypothetical protein
MLSKVCSYLAGIFNWFLWIAGVYPSKSTKFLKQWIDGSLKCP